LISDRDFPDKDCEVGCVVLMQGRIKLTRGPGQSHDREATYA